MYLKRSIYLLALLLLSCVTADAADFARIADRKPAALEDLVNGVRGADVIFIGEIHHNSAHHAAQLDIVRALHGNKIPVAIGLEMFTPEDQKALDDWSAGRLDEESFVTIYSRNWSYGWELYRDLFIFARDNRIPLIGLNIPQSLISRVTREGSTSVTPGEVPPGLSWKLNESQTDYMRTIAVQVFGSNPPERYLARLCEAQALRNGVMAWNVSRYARNNPGRTVVILAGIWHAVKHGVPELLAGYGDFRYMVVAPELAEFNLDNATVREADYLIMKTTEKGNVSVPDGVKAND